MLHIRFTPPRVDDPKKPVIGLFIDNHIINNATLIVEEKTIEGAADRAVGQVVGESVVGELIGLGAVDSKPPAPGIPRAWRNG